MLFPCKLTSVHHDPKTISLTCNLSHSAHRDHARTGRAPLIHVPVVYAAHSGRAVREGPVSVPLLPAAMAFASTATRLVTGSQTAALAQTAPWEVFARWAAAVGGMSALQRTTAVATTPMLSVLGLMQPLLSPATGSRDSKQQSCSYVYDRAAFREAAAWPIKQIHSSHIKRRQ